MTLSFLLTDLHPTSGTDPLDADCTKRNGVLPPFGITTITTTHPAGTRSGSSSTSTTPTTDSDNTSECDPYDASSINKPRTNHTWTGTPIRAIVPLPRRKPVGANGAQEVVPSRSRSVHVPANTLLGSSSTSSSRSTRSAHPVWDDVDTDSDSEAEADSGDEAEGDKGSDGDCDTASRSRCCSYESITATEGLSAWSFEELRVECYAQTLVARGTKPPPVVQPALAIPPAFVPRSVLRS